MACTTTNTPDEPKDGALSCHFDALNGRNAEFRGFILREGEARLPPGKRVLIWAVFAPEGSEASALLGRCVGTTGGRVGALKGGTGGSVLLEPTTATSQIDDQPVPSVLELRVAPVKA